MAFTFHKFLPSLRHSLRSSLRYYAAGASQVKPVRRRKFENECEVSDELADEFIFTEEHVELRRTLRKIIEKDINPYVDAWEEEGAFPAHEVFKNLGNAGFLGVNKPIEYGGMGLDFSYAMAIHEELGKFLKKLCFCFFRIYSVAGLQNCSCDLSKQYVLSLLI